MRSSVKLKFKGLQDRGGNLVLRLFKKKMLVICISTYASTETIHGVLSVRFHSECVGLLLKESSVSSANSI